MSAQEYIGELKNYQSSLLEYIDKENDVEINFQDLENQMEILKVFENQYKLKIILNLIIKIANNHHRRPNFFIKIEKILQILKDSIIKYFSNMDIFSLFKSNKRILLFLIEEGIMHFDDQIVKKMIEKSKFIKAKYPEYFKPEIKKFENEEWFPKQRQYEITRNEWVCFFYGDLPENFNENRKIGENEDHICKLIREDSIVDFISFVTKNNINLNSNIKLSIYETNHFPKIKVEGDEYLKNPNFSYETYYAKDREVKLIEYAAFFGSLQVFNYLKMNEAELTTFLWQFAIHGKNAYIIHLLEDLHVEIESNDLLYNEAVKCHHNDIAKYFMFNFLPVGESTLENEFKKSIKYYNFDFWEEKYVNESFFGYFCIYDYYLFADLLVKNKCIDINKLFIEPENSRTALYLAVKKGNIDIAKLLLENDKIDVNIINKSHEIKSKSKNNDLEEEWWHWREQYSSKFVVHEETVLFLAIEEGYNEIIKLLLENPKTDLNIISTVHYYDRDEEKYEETPLFLAMEKKNLDIFKLLLQNDKVDPNIINKIYILNTNITSGSEDEYECTAFYWAVEQKYIEFAKILIENEKVDPNIRAKGWSKDYECCDYRYYEKAPIYIAAEKHEYSLLKLLVENDKIDINIMNKVIQKHSEVFIHCTSSLLKNFQDDVIEPMSTFPPLFEEVFNNKHTVLHLVANDEFKDIKGVIKMIKILMSNKNICINIKDNHEKRPIFYATKKETIKAYYFYFFQNRYNLKKKSQLINQ